MNNMKETTKLIINSIHFYSWCIMGILFEGKISTILAFLMMIIFFINIIRNIIKIKKKYNIDYNGFKYYIKERKK